MKEVLIVFFQESENRTILVGVGIGLAAFITVSLTKVPPLKPMYLTMCVLIGFVMGVFVSPLIAEPIGKFMNLQEVGRTALVLMVGSFLAYRNLDIFKRAMEWLDNKIPKQENGNGN